LQPSNFEELGQIEHDLYLFFIEHVRLLSVNMGEFF